jgi:2-polyprenyl-3-methyl-5-hydroxy-6-metoxy-1,4-benzoquinol methylase
MPQDNKEIAVAEVLQRLKEEVRRQRRRLEAKSQGVGALRGSDKLRTAMEEVRATRAVNPHLPIAWPKWPPGVWPKIAAATQKVVRRLLRWYINPIVEQQNAFNAAVAHVLEESAASLAQLRAEQQEEQEITRLRLQRLERKLKQEGVPRSVISQEPALSEAEGISPISQATGHPTTQPMDHFCLGLRFRGPENVKERQRAYVDYFRDCQNVLDIGCGRGEFVELLLEHGIGAHGIDLDPDMVDYAVERGLPVEQAEALEYLTRLPDGSLDGVFMAQVVEHLTPQNLSFLLELCYRKMKPGAQLIAETINPACLTALANWYLIDLSHVTPVHPEAMRFLLEGVGFWQIRFLFLTPVPPQDRLVSLPMDPDASPQEQERIRCLNHNIERLNNFLFGYQDYAAIAQRPPEEISYGY